MTSYHKLVSDYARLLKEGRSFPLGTFKPAPRPEIPTNAPKALFFAPHPDDECIVGGMAVRLMRQARMNLINVAVTLGSKKERQQERLRELHDACNYLGFSLVTTVPNGLEKINPKTREQDPQHWAACVKVIKDIIEQHQPKVVLFPHDRDWNSTTFGWCCSRMSLMILTQAAQCFGSCSRVLGVIFSRPLGAVVTRPKPR